MTEALTRGYEFLYENGAPVLQNEAAQALGISPKGLREEMLKNPQVTYWLDCLAQFMKRQAIHGSADECFENIMYKLLSLGIQEQDHPLLAECSALLIQILIQRAGDEKLYDTINPTILCGWLTGMGHGDRIVCDLARQRIGAVYSFAKKGIYDIYVNPQGYPAIPAARAGHPLVDPALYEGNVWKLPTVHDLFIFARLPKPLRKDGQLQEKIDTAVRYILDERYQRLPWGYGLMLVKPNKYYGMGWSVHLHGYESSGSLKLAGGTVWDAGVIVPFLMCPLLGLVHKNP